MIKNILIISMLGVIIFGSILSSTLVFADQKSKGEPFKAIWEVILGNELPVQIIRFDSGVSQNLSPSEVFFNFGNNQGPQENPSNFNKASTMSGVKGTITEFRYQIGQMATAEVKLVTATLYKNGISTSFTCEFNPSLENSCMTSDSLTVNEGDLLSVSDKASKSFNAESRHSTITIVPAS